MDFKQWTSKFNWKNGKDKWLILLAVGYSVMPLVIMCVAGVIIGLLLLVWEYFDRWDYRRLGQ